jgi:ABC-2 type transport system ATP-binding protein
MMIEAKNLCKSFGPTKAVNDVSFTVEKGEVVGLLGPNGAGKTTTMRLLTCFLAPDSGTATVGGHDILKDPLNVRASLGYLPEGAPLYSDMGVLDYLRFISDIHGMGKEAKSVRLKEMISVCGLRSVIHKNVGELSKGYRQRLGLAAAIIHDPEILILDEPTSGLDPKQNREIRQLIRRIGQEKCVILSTHILSEVEVTCDRAIIISNGKITAEGTVEELSRMARGADIYYVTFRGDISRIREYLSNFKTIEKYDEGKHNGGYSFVLSSGTTDDISEEIFDLAVDGGFKLTHLSREEARLEESFLALTKGDARGIAGAKGGDEDE